MPGPSKGALAGLKVIDLTRVLGGPYCTMVLSDHGAEVIKIEPPQGDEVRDWGPPFHDHEEGGRDAEAHRVGERVEVGAEPARDPRLPRDEPVEHVEDHGEHDHERRRVDLAVLRLVDREEPAEPVRRGHQRGEDADSSHGS